MIPVILSGGSGTRLWPVSRTKLPKQFCSLLESPLQSLTLLRAARMGTPWILTSKALKALTEKNIKDAEIEGVRALYESQAKNTAPAIAFLCQYLILEGRQDEIVAILPADQLIEKEDEFLRAMGLAQKEALNNKIVTLGIKPSFASTGFGYIQTDKNASAHEAGLQSFSVLGFREKPDAATATEFLKAGSYYWNAGIFVFKISQMAEHFSKFEPTIWAAAQKIKRDLSNLDEIYESFRNISIDYAIMEKLSPETLACVPADIGWSDVGSWDAVADVLKESSSTQNSIEVKSHGNYLHALSGKTYSFVGVDDLLVIDTDDALLIAKKGYSQDVKEVVDKLKVLKPKVVSEHVYEERPWGRYEVLKDTDTYKSKVIQVNPFQQISYQSHNKREEHWTITKGNGEVIIDDQVIPVTSGSYVKIPLGAKHRIRNTGPDIVEFIEVQLGTYFGEDDIIRYQDDYQRN